MRNFFDEIIRSTDEVKQEFRNRIAAYLTAAFGLVAGLAWNDAIKSLIAYWFPTEQDTVLMKFVYAFVITIVFVIVSIYIIRFIKKEEQKRKKDTKNGRN